METSLKTGFAQILSCCPKNVSCPKFRGGLGGGGFRGSFRYQSRALCCTGEVFRSFSVTRKNMIFEKMPSSSLLLLQSRTHQSSYKVITLHPHVYPYLSHQTLIGKTQASLR